MSTLPPSLSSPAPAGRFSDWLRDMRASLAGGAGMDVACGDCVGCCTSSYYIKVRAHERRALARIGEDHLEPEAAPDGSRFMGFRDDGHCRMFVAGGCSIYADRPETCRTYDCRVYAAAGMDAGDGRAMINARIAGWRFEFADERDRREHAAVQAAARYLCQHPVRFPSGRVPSRPAEIAVLAVKIYTVFLDPPATDREIVSAIVQAVRDFDRPPTQEVSRCTA